MRMLGSLWLPLVVACGYGFEPVVAIDGAVGPQVDASPDGPPDAPAVLGCTPLQFQVPTAAKWVTAVGTRRGYDVFIVEEFGDVRGYAYQFVGGKLEQVEGTGNLLAVPRSLAPVAALAVDPAPGDDVDVVIAITYDAGTPLATTLFGTIVVPFNAQLQRVDAPNVATMNDGLSTIPGGLVGGDDGKIAFLGLTEALMPALQQVSRRGVATGPALPVNSLNHTVTRHTLLRAASGYLAVWSDNESMPEALTATVIDDILVASAPTVINVTPGHGSLKPFAAYSPGAHRYLFSWLEKVGSLDAIKLRFHDDQLAVASGLIDTGQLGDQPVIAAGDSDFLVAWLDTSNPQQAVAARVKPDGSLRLRSATSTGGGAATLDVAARNGQPALFWIETGGSLWVDAMCFDSQ